MKRPGKNEVWVAYGSIRNHTPFVYLGQYTRRARTRAEFATLSMLFRRHPVFKQVLNSRPEDNILDTLLLQEVMNVHRIPQQLPKNYSYFSSIKALGPLVPSEDQVFIQWGFPKNEVMNWEKRTTLKIGKEKSSENTFHVGPS